MKFIHSSDLQIGKAFGSFESEIGGILQDARQAAVRTLGELAAKHNAAAVLLAGDIYEKQQVSQQTLARSIESMRPFTKVTWHLMPGNHDHLLENGLWDRLARMQLPENVRLHTQPGAVQIADHNGVPVFLLPSPLRHTASPDDLSSYMNQEATPDGAIRIGMAHGSVQGFGAEGEAANYVSPARADDAGLTYLAMGDWHRQIKINDRTWYSGTPEPDQFKLPPNATNSLCNGGTALLVEISSPRIMPRVTPIETGRYRWHKVERILTEDGQVSILEADLRALDSNLSRVVLDLCVTGTLSLAGRRSFEDQIVQGIGAALRAMRYEETGLVLNPTEEDLDEIDHAGFVRVAADRLKALVSDPSDPHRARLASLALKRLYIEHLRQAGRL
jgi:DNA repair exonuclease SbcCD nuclease subunit